MATLVYEATGKPVQIGDRVEYQDRAYRVADIRETSNTILLQYPSQNPGLTFDFDPVVFNMVWVNK